MIQGFDEYLLVDQNVIDAEHQRNGFQFIMVAAQDTIYACTLNAEMRTADK